MFKEASHILAMEDHIDRSSSEQPASQGKEGEVSPLIEKRPFFQWSVLALRYRTTRKCITSESALLILFWSFAVKFTSQMVFSPHPYIKEETTLISYYGVASLIHCFFPFAGYLADNKFGRYKIVISSLHIVLSTMMFALVGVTLMILNFNDKAYYIGAGITGTVGSILLVGKTGFAANVVPFGMDQLHDSPGEDQSLFIHWFVWVYHIGNLVSEMILHFSVHHHNNGINPYVITGISMLFLLPLLVSIFVIISLCVARHRQRWFHIEPGRVNPYKLVYRVTKFGLHHKIPIHRSAFTYCEDKLPSGLDLGKSKYGGPFTTEEVEDVKTFFGIVRVLFSFGPVFFLKFAACSMFSVYAKHNIPYHPFHSYNLEPDHSSPNLSLGDDRHTDLPHVLINSNLLSPLLVIIFIPLYVCLIRPFVSYYIPGMLKRMGIGMLLVIMSLIVTFTVDTVVHSKNTSIPCMFQKNENDTSLFQLLTPFQATTSLILQHTLSALSNMLIYIGSFEFICSQSPHSMKGMLIGLWYAIKGLFQLMATLLTLPFSLSWPYSFPSCGFCYYFINIAIGLLTLITYACIARGYKYRERDEPSNEHKYAEEYYSNTEQELNYDYSIN